MVFNLPDNVPVTAAPLPPMLLPDEQRPSLLAEGETLRIDHPLDSQRWIIGRKLAGDIIKGEVYVGGQLIKTLEFWPAIKADYCLQDNMEAWIKWVELGN